MNKSVTAAFLILTAFCLCGCAGFVAGDLRNTKSDCRVSSCSSTNVEYQVIYNGNATDDYGNKNPAVFITAWSLGIVPTYWTTRVHSEATILHNGVRVYSQKYKSRVHAFYGLFWALILPTDGINALQADEGGGLRAGLGIRKRTICRVIADYGGNEKDFCVQDEESQ